MIKRVYGYGINDLKGQEVTSTQREYKLWRDVLKRCYDKSYLAKFPTYESASVVEEWKLYSCFRRDVRQLKNFDKLWEGWVLDKDAGSTEKVYSKTTCCILPQQVNIFFSTFSTNHNPAFDARRNVYYCYCSHNNKRHFLGTFQTKEDSRKAYVAFKYKTVLQMLECYGGILDEMVVNKLLEHKEVLYEQMCML